MYIAKVSLWKGCEGGLRMIWTKWVMTKVLANEWVVMWCYWGCGLMSSVNEGAMSCWIWYA